MFLLTPIEYLKGVGPQRAEVLKKELGIFTFGDLLHYYPYRYIDRSKIIKVNELNTEQQFVQLRGVIPHTEIIGERRSKRFIAQFRDNTGTVPLIWFQGIKWLQGKFRSDTEYLIFGKPSVFKGKFSLLHPEVEAYSEDSFKTQSALQAMYYSTESSKNKGLDSKGILRLQATLHEQIGNNIEETLSTSLISEFKLIGREQAVKQIHFPKSYEELKKAQLRLKFEELFFLQLKLMKQQLFRKKTIRGEVFSSVGDLFNTFFHNHLPFPLTNAQKRVIKEIRSDFGSGRQMNRLLQGDVGSGKTVVALMTMLLALDNHFQASLMAPTEILATQHYESISTLLKEMPVKVALLTGSTKSKQRKELLQQLSEGEVHLLIGTHALIEDAVRFKRLGFVVIDEQHRFGVAQRAKLRDKADNPPHILIMTATPIPRTLAMTLYGDLDTSVIDEMPPGRKPVKTIHMTDNQRLRMFGFMREQIAAGKQVYVVYPLIQESEKLDLKNLEEGYESIEREFPMPEYQISIMHGKLSAEKKEFEMQRFIKGQTHIMVSTTVIDVGVNVPNATVMVIENAERFGLSQLHQLRGRVGRGADQSYCILMTSFKQSAESKIRMETMCRTNDGFEISEVDLRLRGPGDLAGTQQSGILDLKLADLAKDQQLLVLARNAANALLEEDPELSLEENKNIRNKLTQEESAKGNWSRVA